MESGQGHQAEYRRIIKSPGFPGDFHYTLDNKCKNHYNDLAIGVWRSLVSRLVRVQEASGSNPDTPTKKERPPKRWAFFFARLTGIRTIKCNCPVDSCLPTARRRQLLDLLHRRKCHESRYSDQKEERVAYAPSLLFGLHRDSKGRHQCAHWCKN